MPKEVSLSTELKVMLTEEFTTFTRKECGCKTWRRDRRCHRPWHSNLRYASLNCEDAICLHPSSPLSFHLSMPAEQAWKKEMAMSLRSMCLCDYRWMCRNNSQKNHRWWFFSSSICDLNTSYVVSLVIDHSLRQSKPFQSVIQQWDLAMIRPVCNRSVSSINFISPGLPQLRPVKTKRRAWLHGLGKYWIYKLLSGQESLSSLTDGRHLWDHAKDLWRHKPADSYKVEWDQTSAATLRVLHVALQFLCNQWHTSLRSFLKRTNRRAVIVTSEARWSFKQWTPLI